MIDDPILRKAQALIEAHGRLDGGVVAIMAGNAALRDGEEELSGFWVEVWKEIRATVH